MPVVAYYSWIKKVDRKEDAEFVTFRDGWDFIHLPKSIIKEKEWEKLPEYIS